MKQKKSSVCTVYIFEGRVILFFFFLSKPLAKISAFLKTECKEQLAFEISLPKLLLLFLMNFLD